MYVLSAAQYGAHNPSRLSWGESIAFDPWGRELGRLRSLVDDSHGADKIYAEGGEFFLCEIDPQVIK